jgi:hypothetical protein
MITVILYSIFYVIPVVSLTTYLYEISYWFKVVICAKQMQWMLNFSLRTSIHLTFLTMMSLNHSHLSGL